MKKIVLKEALSLLKALIDNGPYIDEDGECSFCRFYGNDSDETENVFLHKDKCLWKRGKKLLAAQEK
jgi:hypothetical protein